MYGFSSYGTFQWGSEMKEVRAGFYLERTESLVLQDVTVRKDTTRRLVEAMVLVDTIRKSITRVLTTEVLRMTDSVLRTIGGVTAGIWERVSKISTIWTRTNKN